MTEERWVRFRHRHRPDIEYDVEKEGRVKTRRGVFRAKAYEFKDEACVRIRTIRNLSFAEEVHQPAYTMMPAELFFDVYQRVEEAGEPIATKRGDGLYTCHHCGGEFESAQFYHHSPHGVICKFCVLAITGHESIEDCQRERFRRRANPREG